jgi:hypothetical protein
MSSTNDNAADMLRRVGVTLYPDDPEFHIRLAHRLGVKVSVVKDWRSGRRKSFNRSHPVFETLVDLMRQREDDIRQARIELERWRSNAP